MLCACVPCNKEASLSRRRTSTVHIIFPSVTRMAGIHGDRAKPVQLASVQRRPMFEDRTRPPLPEEWESYRTLISHLYKVDELPLKSVQAVLADKYGLHATYVFRQLPAVSYADDKFHSERMFKTRIKNWGLQKRTRRHDMVFTKKQPKRKRTPSPSSGPSGLDDNDPSSSHDVCSKRHRPSDLQEVKRTQRLSSSPESDRNVDWDRNSSNALQTATDKLLSSLELSQKEPFISALTIASQVHAPSVDYCGKHDPNDINVASTFDSMPKTALPHPQLSSTADVLSQHSLLPTSSDSLDLEMLRPHLDAVASQMCLPQSDSTIDATHAPNVWHQFASSASPDSISVILEHAAKLTPSTDSQQSLSDTWLHNVSSDEQTLESTAVLGRQHRRPDDAPSVTPPEVITFATTTEPASLRTRQLQSPLKVTESWRWVSRCFHACILTANGLTARAMSSTGDAARLFSSRVTEQDPMLLTAPILLLPVLQCQGQKEMAKVFMSNAFEGAKAQLSINHPIVQALSWQVALGGATLADCSVGCSELRHILGKFTQDSGHGHPYTLTTLYMLGFDLIRYKEYEEAERNLRDLASRSERVLGAYHVQTVAALTALARVLGYLKQDESSECKWLDALERSKQLLGEDHPQRLEIRRRLGAHYEAIGRPEQAKNVYREVLAGRVRMLGPQHPFTQGSLEDFVNFLQKQDWADEAVEIRSEVETCKESDDFSVRFPRAY